MDIQKWTRQFVEDEHRPVIVRKRSLCIPWLALQFQFHIHNGDAVIHNTSIGRVRGGGTHKPKTKNTQRRDRMRPDPNPKNLDVSRTYDEIPDEVPTGKSLYQPASPGIPIHPLHISLQP